MAGPTLRQVLRNAYDSTKKLLNVAIGDGTNTAGISGDRLKVEGDATIVDGNEQRDSIETVKTTIGSTGSSPTEINTPENSKEFIIYHKTEGATVCIGSSCVDMVGDCCELESDDVLQLNNMKLDNLNDIYAITDSTIDQTLDDSTFGITYTTGVDMNWSSGSTLTGTLVNGATVTGGILDLTGGTAKQAVYTPTGATNANKGTIKFEYISNHDGLPASTIDLFTFATDGTLTGNWTRLKLDAGGNIKLDFADETAAVVKSNILFGSKVMTIGTRYEIEFNYDFSSGDEVQRLFIDGVQNGTDKNETGTRSDDLTTVTYFRFGGGSYSNHSIDNVLFYSEMQHSADYTSGYVVPESRYGVPLYVSAAIKP